jgi:hypothetical protein
METQLMTNQFDEIIDSIISDNDEKASLISSNILKYHDTGMLKAEEAAKEGAVSYVLSKFGMNLVKDVDPPRTETLLNVIDFDGNKGSITHSKGNRWIKKSLSKFDEVMPQDALDRIPLSMADSMVVWEPSERARDPLLCIPILWSRINQISQPIFKVIGERHFLGLAMRSKLIKEDAMITVKIDSPYYALVAKWQ